MDKYREIFIFEFKRRTKGMLIWLVLWVLFIALIVAFYDSVQASAEQLKQVLATFPPQLIKALGSDVSSLTSLQGLFNSRFTTFSLIIGGIWAGWIGAQMIGRDNNTGALVWLSTQPVTRKGIYYAKLLAVSSWIFIVNFGLMFITMILSRILTSVKEIPFGFFMSIGLGLSIYYILIIAIGNIGAVLWKEENGRGISIIVVIFSYLMNVVQILDTNNGWAKYLTSVYYFNPDQVAADGYLDVKILFLVAITLILIFLGQISFSRKNIGE